MISVKEYKFDCLFLDYYYPGQDFAIVAGWVRAHWAFIQGCTFIVDWPFYPLINYCLISNCFNTQISVWRVQALIYEHSNSHNEKHFDPWHLRGLSAQRNSHFLFHLKSSTAEMQKKSAAGRMASFPRLSLAHLYFPWLPSSPSTHPSIHPCSLALCGESAVTVCPSSCGPSCLGQMGSSPPHPPSRMMSMRGPRTWSHGQLAPKRVALTEPKNMEKICFCCTQTNEVSVQLSLWQNSRL